MVALRDARVRRITSSRTVGTSGSTVGVGELAPGTLETVCRAGVVVGVPVDDDAAANNKESTFLMKIQS